MVTFQLPTVDSRLTGGTWELRTESVAGGLLTWSVLASGDVPTPGGSLTIPVSPASVPPLDPALPLGSEVFMLELFEPADGSHAIVGNGLEVRPASQVVAGSTIAFHPVVDEVPTYPSAAAAEAASGCPTCQPSQDPGNLPATDASGNQVFNPQSSALPTGAPASRPSTPTTAGTDFYLYTPHQNPDSISVGAPWPQGPSGGPVNPALQGVTNAIPSSPPCLPATCVVAAGSQAQPVGQCNSYSQGAATHYNCVSDAYNFAVASFRGWANKTAGMVDTFSEDYAYTQGWDNGYRDQAGPFSNSGTASIEYTSGGTITWDTDGDCWSGSSTNPSTSPATGGNGPSSTGDSPEPCGYDGWWSTWGNDTWRWEKHDDTICGGADPTCTTITYESLFDYVNNGGNQYNPNNGMTGDLMQPSNVHQASNPYGDWAEYIPSSNASTLYFENSSKNSNSASIDISYSDSFSNTQFDSSMTNTTSNKVSNTYTFRGPNQGLPWGGDYWAYDGATPQSGWSPWAWRFWTCSFNTGYWGALDSSEAGGATTQCWDYTLS